MVDTSVFVAANDRDDEDHDRCAELLARLTGDLLTTAPILGESGWMLDLIGPESEARLYRTVTTGAVDVEELTLDDWARVAELTEKYGDHPLGGFDATLLAVAERLGIGTIATLDHRHFRAGRPKHVAAFKLAP